jgi:hypothetical protein
MFQPRFRLHKVCYISVTSASASPLYLTSGNQSILLEAERFVFCERMIMSSTPTVFKVAAVMFSLSLGGGYVYYRSGANVRAESPPIRSGDQGSAPKPALAIPVEKSTTDAKPSDGERMLFSGSKNEAIIPPPRVLPTVPRSSLPAETSGQSAEKPTVKTSAPASAPQTADVKTETEKPRQQAAPAKDAPPRRELMRSSKSAPIEFPELKK